jgi:Tol biopolymer transport system component
MAGGTTSKGVRVSLAVLAAGLVASALASAGSAPKTSLISVNSSEVQGDSDSQYTIAVTPDGRFVAFQSGASNLSGGDEDSYSNVFLRNRKQGRTKLVSVKLGGGPGNDGDSGRNGLAITPDHRYVAFDSISPSLVQDDTEGHLDVFVRDLKKRKTKRVSVSSSGEAGDDDSGYHVQISPDGRYVAFASNAGNLVPNDGNGSTDVFVRDLKKGKTTLVSRAIGGGTGDDVSGEYAFDMSGNGRYVAFDSGSSDLVAADGNGSLYDIFVRDLRKHKTKLVSVGNSEQAGDADTDYGAALSRDGRFVAFGSQAENLTGNDGNGLSDVFVRDRKNRTTRLASLASNGDQGDDNSGSQGSSGYKTLGISDDGRFVEFDSFAENLVGNDGNGWIDVFVRDLKRHRTKLASQALDGTSGNDESGYYSATMTPDARFVAFNSGADDLVPSDANGSSYDIFIRGPLR